MDRLKQIRGEAGGSRDSTLDTTSPPSEAFMSANDTSSKYFSITDSTFDITDIKDVSTSSKLDETITGTDQLISNLSPIGKKDILDDYKIGKEIEAGSILSGGVNIFEDNDNSYDGNELVIDDNVDLAEKSLTDKPDVLKTDDSEVQTTLTEPNVEVPSKDTEVVLQIDGRNVDAIDIGNGLYLYRKYGRESVDELAAVQIIDDGQNQPTFKFLKVRENAEGNLEVYEEIEIEVPPKEGAPVENPSHVPINDNKKLISEQSSNKVAEKNKTPQKQPNTSTSNEICDKELDKTEVNFNGKMMKCNESRKSPVVGSFTPMTYHSTPNKEGKPLTKTMVDLQLQPSRHSDNVKKTIEVHTDSNKHKTVEVQAKKLLDDTIQPDGSVDQKVDDKSPENVEVKTSTVTDTEIKDDKLAENLEKVIVAPEEKLTEEQTESNAEQNIENNDLSVSESKIEGDKEAPLKEVSPEKPELANVAQKCENVTTEAGKEKEEQENNEKKVIDKEIPTESVGSIIAPDINELKACVKEENKVHEIDEKLVDKDEKLLIDNNIVDIKDNEHKTVKNNEREPIMKVSEPPKPDFKVSEGNSNVPSSKEIVNEVSIDKDIINDVSVDKEEKNSIPIAISKEEHLTSNITEPTNELLKPIIENVYEAVVENISAEEVLIDHIDKLDDDEDKLVINEETLHKIPTDTKTVKDEIDSVQDKLVIDETDEVVTAKPGEIVSETNTPECENIPEVQRDSLLPKTELKDEDKSKEDAKSNKTLIRENPVKMVEKLIASNVVSSSKSDVVDKKSINQSEKQSEVFDKNIPILKLNTDVKPINNNHTPAVPFGQWTAANRQEFLNKFKDAYKTPVHSNTKQIKNSNDLNRRDVLKKIDSQRQHQSNIALAKDKNVVKNETIFSSKIPTMKQEPILSVKKDPTNTIDVKLKVVESTKSKDIEPTKSKDIESTKSKVIEATKSKVIEPTKSKVIEPTKSKVTEPTKSEVIELTKSKMIERTKSKIIEPTKVKEDAKVSVTVATSTMTTCTMSGSNMTITETSSRRQMNVNDIINKTIEDMINNVVPCKALTEESKTIEIKPQELVPKQNVSPELKEQNTQKSKSTTANKTTDDSGQNFDYIEMKMNELHGIPFVERPPHQLPNVLKSELKTYSKADKQIVTNKVNKKSEPTVASTQENQVTVDNSVNHIIDIDSEEEVIEHEPVTGDIALNSKLVPSALPIPQPKTLPVQSAPKKAVITENEFDKFARRNSVTYEDCITVNYDKKEPHKIQNVRNITKIATMKPKPEIIALDPKSKLPHKQTQPHNLIPSKPLSRIVVEDPNNKNYQSKIHLAYQTVLTSRKTKRLEDRPITIIEDKPVKVVFMDAGSEFTPGQLNVQGKELSPAKKPIVNTLTSIIKPANNTVETVNLDMSEIEDKHIDDSKSKTKHQRKQVLTPVEAPAIELIQPKDLGLDVSPKKKRKTEDTKTEKNAKVIHKKSYLLGRSTTSDGKVSQSEKSVEIESKQPLKDAIVTDEVSEIKNTSSALDNLVKAAELIEKSGNMNKSTSSNSESPQQNTPVKRGRGRPRKYPLPDATPENKLPSPQKKPRLIDAKPVKERSISISDTSDDDEMVRENWTMGKINENIVCPICNKLFRSENVVFKHVKHCTGVSPNRSDSDKQSGRRSRHSQESDLKSLEDRSEDMDIDSEEKSNDSSKHTSRKRKSKESIKSEKEADKNEVIVIEDTPPVKEKTEKNVKEKEKQKLNKTKLSNRFNGHICEFCGKTFRQLSYLMNHKLQHKKEEPKKIEKIAEAPNKAQVFSCEVCKKEFRKLHHLVQHRIIHNPNVPSRTLRKNSSEQTESKPVKDKQEQTIIKQNDDPSAAFRCEPCDKSFRKLHHLVEHRETHDGINRQKTEQKTVATPPAVVEKPVPPPPQCDVCKKTFRKLHHLIEHKEQHVEASSEKLTDKERNAKSALSTKDIIHECSLCYMVFPNEHSLNKHTVICQRKKRQSKTAKNINEEKSDENNQNSDKDIEDVSAPKIIAQEIIDDDDDEDIEPISNLKVKEHTERPAANEMKEPSVEKPSETVVSTITTTEKVADIPIRTVQKERPVKVPENSMLPVKRDLPVAEKIAENEVTPEKIKKIEENETSVHNTTKKKILVKDKVASNITKRQRSDDTKETPATEVKPSVESSDDDEVRYMLNPDFKLEENEGKTFMEVRATKRNSLQIERPNSKDLMKRRTSLQHPPKIPKLKPKPVESKVVLANASAFKPIHKVPTLEAAPSTDSDDSDVKYSFAVPAAEKPSKPERTLKEADKKPGRKSVADKRKSLSSIAKRKFLGEALISKRKAKASPAKVVKKRVKQVEHRCDCGELFNSAALLSRHTSLAHTPPRIRRRRSSPPPPPPPTNKQRKSNKPNTPETRKSIKTDTNTNSKPKKMTPAHRGVPVPEKMRKIKMKIK